MFESGATGLFPLCESAPCFPDSLSVRLTFQKVDVCPPSKAVFRRPPHLVPARHKTAEIAACRCSLEWKVATGGHVTAAKAQFESIVTVVCANSSSLSLYVEIMRESPSLTCKNVSFLRGNFHLSTCSDHVRKVPPGW